MTDMPKTVPATDLETLQAIVAEQTRGRLDGLRKDAAMSGAACIVESRAARVTGYYIAARILDYPMDLTQAYLSLRAARMAVRMIEGDSPKSDALDEVETEALRMLTEIAENAPDAP